MEMQDRGSKGFGILPAMLIAAGGMFLFDPVSGRRRRALLRDKSVKLKNQLSRLIEKKAINIFNHAKGLYYESMKALEHLPSIQEMTGNQGPEAEGQGRTNGEDRPENKDYH